jgi:soluble lytic murein transglycosylase-like protein
MKKRILVVLGGAVLLLTHATMSRAEDKIQAFVNKGKVVFTNLVENPPVVEVVPAVEISASTPTSRGEIPPSLNSLVNAISKTHGVDPALVKAVMKTESGYNRFAVSPKGAMGLMQLIPGTGKRFGVRDFFDPQQNIEGGVRYLKFLIEKFEGNLDLSIAAYNAGENLVERLGRIPAIPETRDYVRKVRSNYQSRPTLVAANSVMLANVNDIAAAPVEQTPAIFRTVDQRGVVHFSNIEPPN